MNTITRSNAVLMAVLLTFGASAQASAAPVTSGDAVMQSQSALSNTLTARQQAIPLIAAYTAAGDINKLNDALNRGLDAGLTINETKEILIQLYAYTGFPRSLNALSALMSVVQQR